VNLIDPFEGKSIAVFDQNYFARSFRNRNGQVKVVSLWKPDSVRVLLAYSNRECAIAQPFLLQHRFYASRLGYYPDHYFEDGFSDSICIVNGGTEKVIRLSVKVGEQIFQLQNQDGQFPISAKLATALKAAPEKDVKLRITADNGEVVDSAIGQGTVKAWRSIY
jgi:hypothetical protein